MNENCIYPSRSVLFVFKRLSPIVPAMPNPSEEIYIEFVNHFEESADYSIAFYKRHSIYLNNVKSFADEEELNRYIDMLFFILTATNNKTHYKETLKIAAEMLPVIEAEALRYNFELLDNDKYRKILFDKAVACYYLKDYKAAVSIFETLRQADPNSYGINNWYLHSRHQLRKNFVNVLLIGSCISAVIYIFAKEYMSPVERVVFLGICLFGLITHSLNGWFFERRIKKWASQ